MKQKDEITIPKPVVPEGIKKPKELLTICAFRGDRKKWIDFRNRCKFMKRDIYSILEPYMDEFMKATHTIGATPEELESRRTHLEQSELRRAFIEAEEEGRVLQVGK